METMWNVKLRLGFSKNGSKKLIELCQLCVEIDCESDGEKKS